MNEIVAQMLVKSLLERLIKGVNGYNLPSGIVSTIEHEALMLLAGFAPSPTVVPPESSTPQAPAIVTNTPLNLDCCTKAPDEDLFVCVDFGTAYSKAAAWDHDEDDPIPLDLNEVATGSSGYTVESSAYIAGDHVLFGSAASARHRLDNDDEREIFDSPKEYLTHEDDLDGPLKMSLDPTKSFRKRELLTLYLGYLSALTSRQLEANGINRHAKRRFAIPGWGNAQIDSSLTSGPAARLGSLFLEAQILADNIPLEQWNAGIPVEAARSTLDRIAAIDPEQRSTATFRPQPILEAIAASVGVHERFQNQRPQLLVIDVGAGTTDIGVFKLATPSNGPALAFPYRNGMSALRKAGNAVDNLLIREISRKLDLSADSQLDDLYQRKLKRRIRETKLRLFEQGSTTVDLEDFASVEITRDEFVSSQPVRRFADDFRKKIIDTLNAAGIGSANFVNSSEENLAVFTGGGAKLPFLTGVFDEPLALDGGRVKFTVADSEPDWVDGFGPDFRALFPQLAVATGGASPSVPDQKTQVMDTRKVGERKVKFFTG